MERIPITGVGHRRLQEELKTLKSAERPAVIKAIAAAREHGDLSENAEYHAARERQSFIEGRIGDLEDATKRAEIIDTYGWLLIKGGRLEKGLSLLEKAARRSPENGDIRYHLAAALAKAGDQTRARNELDTLLESGKDFPEKSAAQALYQVLK